MESSYPFGKLIDPIEDAGFKLIFGRESVSEELIKDLLNSIFANDPLLSNITEVTFLNTEKPNESIGGRGLRYDIRCVTSTGHHFIVEMQKAEQRHFLERCIYYLSRDFAEQGYKGKDQTNKHWDFSLTPVVGVFFCNFPVRELGAKPVVQGRLMDVEDFKPIGDYLRYVFIQLPCFEKGEKECATLIEQWIFNIKNMGQMQNVAFKEQREIFAYLDSVANVAALSPSERDTYEAALMRARDYNAQMKTAREKGWESGRKEGWESGMQQGMQQGLQQGLQQGRSEEKKMIVRNMAALQIPVSLIAQTVQLTEEEVSRLLLGR